MDNNEMYRQVIMDHYKNPHNKVDRDFDTSTYITREALNPSCGDMVRIMLKLDGDVVSEIKFIGEGCSICCASASVMTLELSGLSKEELSKRVDLFEKIIKDGDESNLDVFEDAQVFTGIKNFPARYKCAYISWDTAKKIIEEA